MPVVLQWYDMICSCVIYSEQFLLSYMIRAALKIRFFEHEYQCMWCGVYTCSFHFHKFTAHLVIHVVGCIALLMLLMTQVLLSEFRYLIWRSSEGLERAWNMIGHACPYICTCTCCTKCGKYRCKYSWNPFLSSFSSPTSYTAPEP